MNRTLRRVLGLAGRARMAIGGAPARRDLLFAAQGQMMAGHLARVYRVIEDLPSLQPFLVLPSRKEKVPGEYAQARALLEIPEVSDARAHLNRWKMVLMADHGYFRDLSAPGRQCTVYIGHHSTSKCAPGDDLPYPIGSRARDHRGRIRYTRIFEASDHVRERLLRFDPELREVVAVVGRIEHDELLAIAADRDQVRRSLGFAPEEKVVLVMGTWGEHSLFRQMGERLIKQAHSLRDRYRFILTTHPHEYRKAPGGKLSWGERLLGLREQGFLVREPWDDANPYLIACDLIVTDHTSLAHSAALLRKPAVYVPIPENDLWEGAATRRYHQISAKLSDPDQLEFRLREALEDPPTDQLTALAREINSCPGEARQRIRAEIAALLS